MCDQKLMCGQKEGKKFLEIGKERGEKEKI